MTNSAFAKALSEISCGLQNERHMSRYTSFQIGGEADFVIKPRSADELSNAVGLAQSHGVDYIFVGSGSNLLVSDEGYRGLVILTSELNKIEMIDDRRVLCECGVPISRLCRYLLSKKLSGMEFAYGIPGTVGGGIYMNAGAYGGECCDVLESCQYINTDGRVLSVPLEGLEMSYRHSLFTGKKLFIISGIFALNKGEFDEINAKMSDYLERRRSKQPLEFPSCGSTFKRPKDGFASALIDECGLKGYSIGGAQVSEKHAGFVINKGGATCSDVLSLIDHIKTVVLKEKGIQLECEVETLGI